MVNISPKVTDYITLFKQFIKYFGVALIGYCFDFFSLLLFKEVFQLHYLIAATIGFTLGLIITYILSNKYVFGESKLKSKRVDFIVFSLIGLIGLVVLNLLMWGLTDGLKINYLISKVLSTVVVYIWNFFARRSLYKS